MKLIVGIDPGVTVGLAIVGLVQPFGKRDLFFKTMSRRNFSKSEIISEIAKYGEPVAVCTDKKNMSSLARQIASAFSAKKFSLKKDLTKEEKAKMTVIYVTENVHESDALASALYYFEHIRSKLVKIEKKVPSDISKDKVIGFVIKNGFSIDKAIKFLRSPKTEQKKIIYHTIIKAKDKELKKENEKLKKSLILLRVTLERLKEENGRLLNENKKLEKHMDGYVKKYVNNRIRSCLDQIRCLKKENQILKKKIKKLSEKNKLNKDYEKIICIKNITKKCISSALKDEIIYVEHMDGNIRNMEKAGPKLVITPDKNIKTLKTEIPFIIRSLHLKRVGEDYFIKKSELEDIKAHIEDWFIKWIKEYKERFK